MTYLEKKEKESHLLYLIKNQRLHSLEKTANNFECSTRTIKRMINDLRTEGFIISYCKKSNKYLIEEDQSDKICPS